MSIYDYVCGCALVSEIRDRPTYATSTVRLSTVYELLFLFSRFHVRYFIYTVPLGTRRDGRRCSLARLASGRVHLKQDDGCNL